MTTITAKELRDNLSATLKRVQNGEEIRIIYRSRPIGRLVPQKSKINESRGNGAAIARAIEEIMPRLKKHKSTLDPNKNFKEIYKELTDNDPKYARYVRKKK
jgi:prevent-host-death family protein